jgi:hypothetical protein
MSQNGCNIKSIYIVLVVNCELNQQYYLYFVLPVLVLFNLISICTKPIQTTVLVLILLQTKRFSLGHPLVLGLEPSTRPHHQRPPASAFSPNHGSGRVSTAPAIVAGGTPFPDVARR